jgi:uncharacterized protein YbcC (UPF0753/DUF2309 family)
MTPRTLARPAARGYDTAHPRAPRPEQVDAAVARAAGTVAPLWPLKHFVAVNPFLGLAGQSFEEAARTLAHTAGARMTMPRPWYAAAIREGRIADRHLAAALKAATPFEGMPRNVEVLKAAAGASGSAPAPELVPTVTDVIGRRTGHDWSRIAVERISQWAAAYFDEGQASWRHPWRHLPPYAAWHAEASHDRTPDVLGARGFRAAVRRLPATATDTIPAALARLGVDEGGLDLYLQRLLQSIGGWAGYARYRVWNRELHGERDDTLTELLAVRLAWEAALLDAFAPAGAEPTWAAARERLATPAPHAGHRTALGVDLILQSAHERAWQEELLSRLAPSPDTTRGRQRPAVQAAFCIDVRSEVFRRHLEAVGPGIETIGFAGFFGFPIEYVPLGHETGGAQCPVLLTPKVVIAETLHDAGDDAARAGAMRLLRRRAAAGWKSFKMGAISCFGFVGPVGLAYARKLVTDGFGLSRPVPHPAADGLDAPVRARLAPDLEPGAVHGRAAGLAPADRLAMAEVVLKAMSMTDGFGRLVLLAGHGSTTANNPHATGLDCGACGGHTGEANARVAAAVLNDPTVRAGLPARGITLPADTVFLAGLHDTTTDEVTIYDRHTVPATHAGDLARLEMQLAEAARRTRAERARRLALPADAPVDAAVLGRSRDWAQVRPEWGLAGCAAFIAAPRRRTEGRDLGGRAFLHSYEWRQDDGFGVLELIMTAPMVVASWISLQYYGSTVDNRVFGSGNKTLHNVVGTIGVLEGNGGDLRAGLPWQSVHDGERPAHEPVRLNVVIEAPVDAMNAVIARHEGVRALLDHGWLHLYAMDEGGAVAFKYAKGLAWEPVPADARTVLAA